MEIQSKTVIITVDFLVVANMHAFVLGWDSAVGILIRISTFSSVSLYMSLMQYSAAIQNVVQLIL